MQGATADFGFYFKEVASNGKTCLVQGEAAGARVSVGQEGLPSGGWKQEQGMFINWGVNGYFQSVAGPSEKQIHLFSSTHNSCLLPKNMR